MAGADHDYVELFRELHEERQFLVSSFQWRSLNPALFSTAPSRNPAQFSRVRDIPSSLPSYKLETRNSKLETVLPILPFILTT
jgi:hypothetical protein